MLRVDFVNKVIFKINLKDEKNLGGTTMVSTQAGDNDG